jgi:hypothetical protein
VTASKYALPLALRPPIQSVCVADLSSPYMAGPFVSRSKPEEIPVGITMVSMPPEIAKIEPLKPMGERKP